jgi:outer membrane protein assembly factor BamB
VGELLFIGSCAGTFYAINKTTGQPQWGYDIRKDGKQVSFHGDPLVTNDLILIGTDHSCVPGGMGHVYAFERDSGKVRWKSRSTGVPTDVIQIDSNVHFGTFQDQWSSIALRTGALNWNFSTGTSNPECHVPKAPVTDGRQLFIAGLDGVIYALDASSGRVSWKRKLPASASTALALRDKSIYVGTQNHQIFRLETTTGEVLSQLATESKPVGRIAFADESLLLFLENSSERNGYIISVDPGLKGLRWKRKSAPDWASERPHVWKDSVIAGNCRGDLAAFRVTDGEPQWKVTLKGCIRSIGTSGNMLFTGVQEGTIYAYELAPK